MENLNVWIYCRVSAEKSRDLLNYQEKELKNVADDLSMHIVGITKEISNGKYLSSFEIGQMMTAIKRGKVDAVLIYSNKRITVYDDLFEEFLMFCQMYNVDVYSLNWLKSLISRIDL